MNYRIDEPEDFGDDDADYLALYCANCLKHCECGPAEEDSLTCEHCGHEHASESQFLTSAQIDAQRRELEGSWNSLSLPTPTPKATP